MTHIKQKLSLLYKTLNGENPLSVSVLPGSGSYRSYYRLHGKNETVLGVHNEDISENEAFISFTNHFRSEGLPVPEILANDPENRIYLITDLGDTTLYQFLTEKRAIEAPGQQNATREDTGVSFPSEVLEVYKKVIDWLPVFQVRAGKGLDYAVCYPRAAFDRQSMMWDLNYFKYYFLKLAKVPFDEQTLEDDFANLCDLLLTADSDFFLYRDFQSRNIMVVNGEPWFIDYQGGRRGALQYDIASLLLDGKADIPAEARQTLLNYYLDRLEDVCPVDRGKFLGLFYGFSLIRILQALGAYGFRGYYEQKQHFLQSIPFALRNLRYLRENRLVDFGLNTLMQVIDNMVENAALYNQSSVQVTKHINHINSELKNNSSSELPHHILTVSVRSFSYKKSIPVDNSGNGGGFVFDCRALPNPGRFDEFKQVNGKDQSVIRFLEKEPAVSEFLNHAISLVDQSVNTYIERNFDHLMVSFGCTGGQHRSVYCAEQLTKHLKDKYPVTINLQHLEQDNLNHLTLNT